MARRYDEMPLGGQRLVLGGFVVAASTFGVWWLRRGARVDPRDSDLALAAMLLLACQWIAMGILLRPRGHGLQLHAGRRLLVWAFGICHVGFGVLNAFFPLLVVPEEGSRLSGTGRWGWCGLLVAGGGVLGVAAWRSGRKPLEP